MIKAALFDLDGTLIDSMGLWDKISQDYLTARGIIAPDDIGTIVKNMSFTESAEYYIDRFSLPDTIEQLINAWNEMAYREYAEKIELKKGVRELLAELSDRGIIMVIVTATDRSLVEAVLRRHGILSCFQFIVTVREAGTSKDNPVIFQFTAQKLGIDPEECIVFEDSLHAVLGAKKAGMKVWAVYDSFSVHERSEIKLIADGYVDSFIELLAIPDVFNKL